MSTDLTIAERRVDELQSAMTTLIRLNDRLKTIERELDALHEGVDQAAEAIYNATYFDPDGTREEEADDAR